jgi:osmotically-inducible protein OsmY
MRSEKKLQKLTIIMASSNGLFERRSSSSNLGARNWKALRFLARYGQVNAELMMKSDSELERDVKEELQWNPDLDASDIAVSARNGAVTLTGFVRSYTDKYEAESAAKRIAGVTAVANDLEVRIPSIHQRPDPDIARDAAAAIKNYLPLSYEQIKAVVRDGWVTLEGEVEWQYEQQAAETAVRPLQGVKGLSNLIEIKPRAKPYHITRKIEEAFRRNAEVDANQITIEADGSEVVLKGKVRSWAEREEAEWVAWRAPGVTKVEDLIVVRNDVKPLPIVAAITIAAAVGLFAMFMVILATYKAPALTANPF